ncbi:FliI/YscN family ATPase [Sinomonas halotolerans]|uniref:FliI/YscN family ATPase n=1 Tax=Sinomonas halotolerans TaxID=1644133 RepID=A0ABU9WYR2_9MICC
MSAPAAPAPAARWAVPARWAEAVAAAAPERVGEVTRVHGLGLQVAGLECAVGDRVLLGEPAGVPGAGAGAALPGAGVPGAGMPGAAAGAVEAEVVSSSSARADCVPVTAAPGLRPGAPARLRRSTPTVPTGAAVLGRILNGLGEPVDGLGPLRGAGRSPLERPAPHPLDRERITQPLATGVRVLDTLTTLGRGQRMGLFAGSGVGKSSLLSMVARGTEAEVNVIALIGERGREVREFLEDDLGPEGLARSVVVVATADEPALMRRRAAFTATAIAAAFRDEGRHAVLMVDSLTRVAMAQREIGLSAGEPPATRGYPPSVFAVLAGLLERAGTDRTGSVTGVYTVLVDGDDHNEPIADTARSILDGHVVLDRRLATAGHFPSVDVLGSVSRVAAKVTGPGERAAAAALRRVLAARRDAQDLIDVGAYQAGANPLVDAALAHQDAIDAFLRQGMDESTPAPEAWARLAGLAQTLTGAPAGVLA